MGDSALYERQTQDVVVRVKSRFLDDQSQPADNQFFWAYHIEIENLGDRSIQLMSRHWKITDRAGRQQVVDGHGVIGKTPVIPPGESFSYTSGAPLNEPSGVMEGHYQLTAPNGEELIVAIPAFSLDSPYDRAAPN